MIKDFVQTMKQLRKLKKDKKKNVLPPPTSVATRNKERSRIIAK